jgi:hypothetical protein
LDSARRDFTINCIYYFSTEYKFKNSNIKKIEEKRNFLEIVKDD